VTRTCMHTYMHAPLFAHVSLCIFWDTCDVESRLGLWATWSSDSEWF
jgi:hypothetical protein